MAAPAIIGAGLAVTLMGRQLLTKAEGERNQLVQAGLELERVQIMVDEFCSQAEMAMQLLTRGREFGEPLFLALKRDPIRDFDVPAFNNVAMVVAVILTILPLPISSEPDESTPLGRAQHANELALDSAEDWMVNAGVLA